MRGLWAAGWIAGCSAGDPGREHGPVGEPTGGHDMGGEQIGEGSTPVFPYAGGVHLLTGAEALAGAPGVAVILGPRDCGYQLVAPGDVDVDGVPDLGVGCSDGLLRVLSGADLRAGGATEIATVHLLSDFEEPAALGDLDGDGVGEIGAKARWPMRTEWGLVLPGAALSGEVWIGTESWRLEADGDAPGDLGAVAAGDLDGDGTPDVAVTGSPSGEEGRLIVVSGARIGAAPPGSGIDIGADPLVDLTAPWGELLQVAPLGDVNGDGLADLAVVPSPWGYPYAPAAPAVRVLWGGSSPAASDLPELAVPQVGTEGYAQAAALGDLDGDGLGEIAVLLHTSGTSEDRGDRLAVVPGAAVPAAGSLDVGPYMLSEEGGYWLAGCDIDADGRPELITSAGIWAGVDLLTPGAPPVAPGTGRAVCLGDLDGDGTSELAWGDPYLGPL